MKRIILLLTMLAATPVAGAEPKLDADATAKKLAPFIDEHTFVMVRVDLQPFDDAALLSMVEPLLPSDAGTRTAIRAGAKAWRQEFLRKGGREICFVFGPTDFPNMPCLLVPLGEPPTDGKDLFELLKPIYQGENVASATIGGFLCISSKAGLDKLKARQPKPRPDIAEALASTNAAPLQIVIVPSADTRKVFEQVAPTLPAEVGGGSIQTLTRGLKWLSLGVGPTPKVELRLIIQSTDRESAQKLQTVIAKCLGLARVLFEKADSQERAAYLKFYSRALQLLTPKLENDRLVVSHDLGTVLPELARLLKDVQPTARTVSMNNLKQLVLACHNYHDAIGRLPANIRSKDGKPLLSWRVHLLPYIEQQALYQQFKLDEPWDSEHNQKLIAQMPKIFHSPKQNAELKNRTTYLAPLGKGLVWDDPKGNRFQDITDGTSNTILIVESDDEHAVIWTRPDDIMIDMKSPTKGLLGHWSDGFLVGMCDGSGAL